MKNWFLFLLSFIPTWSGYKKQVIDLKSYDQTLGILTLGAYGDAQARVTEFVTDLNTLKTMRPNQTDGFNKNYPAIPLLKSLKTNASYVRFTDDTHMSLYLFHALLKNYKASNDVILDSIVQNFIHWNHADQTERAPGITAQKSCQTLESLQKADVSGIDLWGRGIIHSLDITKANQGLRLDIENKEGGSGAVMRTAPISIFFKNDPFRAELLSVAQGIVTHIDKGSRAATAGFDAALRSAMNHDSIATTYQKAIQAAQRYDSRSYSQPYDPNKYNYGSGHFSKNGCAALCQQAQKYTILGLNKKSYHEVLDEFRGWGATEAFAAALYIYSMWQNEPYFAMSIAINRTPGDSDTIAILVGELLGAYHGYKKIVENFKDHGIDFEYEVTQLETIHNLKEYGQDFAEFKKDKIKTFFDLVRTIAARS